MKKSPSQRKTIKLIKPIKPFRTYEEQINNLINHKGLIINDVPTTALHAKLEIPMNGQQYIYGKKDLFAVVISFRYLLTPADFSAFKRRLSLLITNTVRKSDSLETATLLKAMGMPSNWKKISLYQR